MFDSLCFWFNQISVESGENKPSNDLISIQIVDENFGRARDFKVFERSWDTSVEGPETIARVNLESVHGDQANVTAVVLFLASGVMSPIGESLKRYGLVLVRLFAFDLPRSP
jgi:hypothetical protein